MDNNIKEEHEIIEKDGMLIEKDLVKKGVNNKLQHQQSMQHNKQNLDQVQEVDVKPNQFSLQHIDVTINNKIENYSGGIAGALYSEGSGELLPNTQILLYFGSGTEFPVFKTASDENGNFIIKDLPPGFYTIRAYSRYLHCLARNIKVLPGEICNQTLNLTQRN
jgi:hypothetical protein